MVDTAGTLSTLSDVLTKMGAKSVYVSASHGLFTERSIERIDNGSVKKVFVTNSLPLPSKTSDKIVQVSVAPMLAHIILAEHFRSTEYNLRQDYIYDLD